MYDRTIQMRKQNRHKTTANYRRLSGIELPWTLREGLSLDIRRLSWINNSQVSEQEERILKSSKLAEWPVVLKWEKIIDMTGLDDGCPVIGVSPMCSDTLVCKWRTVWPTYTTRNSNSAHRHLNKYTTPDLRNLGTLSLKGKKGEMRLEERKIYRMLRWGTISISFLLI
jgi:hypothetical protein